MCPVTFATLLGVMSGCVADGPSRLLDPLNPALSTNWRPPPSSTAGLEHYTPVDVKNWLEQSRAPGADAPPNRMKTVPGAGGGK